MIEKLDMTGRTIYENTAIAKLNEVIDAVNRLEESIQGVVNNSIADGGRIRLLQEQIHALKTRPANVQPEAESRPSNVQDKFAEQRRWIGKACWFWDEKEEEKVFGILTTIDSDCGLSDMCPYWNDTTKNWFEHCEPVKDDIIYKGGEND